MMLASRLLKITPGGNSKPLRKSCSVATIVASRRCTTKPAWRRVPSLLETVPTVPLQSTVRIASWVRRPSVSISTRGARSAAVRNAALQHRVASSRELGCGPSQGTRIIRFLLGWLMKPGPQAARISISRGVPYESACEASSSFRSTE